MLEDIAIEFSTALDNYVSVKLLSLQHVRMTITYR